MCGGAVWGMLTDRGRYGVVCRQVTVCDPYLSALEVFAEIDVTSTFTHGLVVKWLGVGFLTFGHSSNTGHDTAQLFLRQVTIFGG